MFKDRKEAGALLTERLMQHKGKDDVLVLALPRGGAVTGREVADILALPFDVLIVRKIGFPGEPELAIGAISETGALYLNRSLITAYRIPERIVEQEIAEQKEEIARRVRMYRGGRRIAEIAQRTIILVDDGVATGATMKAAIMALWQEKINKLILAIPVAPPETSRELEKMSDEFVCLETPPYFISVGSYYEDFSQVSDEQVKELLQEIVKGERKG